MKSQLETQERLIPLPVQVRGSRGFFRLDKQTALKAPEQAEAVRAYFAARVKRATGFTLADAKTGAQGVIRLHVNPRRDARLGEEGYRLRVTSRQVDLRANTAGGLFYGVQSVLQLLPSAIESDKPVRDAEWRVPCTEILDYPRFAWRGLMLDVVRHFFSKDEVLAFVDQMARYKFNILHLHLTDDQGWRIEIKRYPRLTDVGAWRVPRTGDWCSYGPPEPGEKPSYGGFYTQADLREIVRYAEARCVTVLPEIDVPGHSLAALAAYPELSCGGGPFYVDPGSIEMARLYGVIKSDPRPSKIPANVLCVGNDGVFEFLDHVMTEVAEVFPSPYIHMGGDEAIRRFWTECPRCQARMREQNLKDEKDLQSYFVKRLARIIESKGKRLVGWDEIVDGGLAPNATVMSWHRGGRGAVEAANLGHDVVMTPSTHCYLDNLQGEWWLEPACTSRFFRGPDHWRVLRLKDCYEFEPVPDGVDPARIVGGQGNLWTEAIPDFRHAQYMLWPRAMAMAETLWSPRAGKEWASFAARVERQFARLDAAQVKYSRALYDVRLRPRRGKQGRLHVALETDADGLDIHYTWDGTNPDPFYPKYRGPLVPVPGARELRVVTCRNGDPVGREIAVPVTELENRAEKAETARTSQ
ncbi:MAG: family 20 glycosylhydrolase [Kiritimatiellae bacterium]|nr:family 20 glycosylhydrolase [Kiritimatiellia bacterium]